MYQLSSMASMDQNLPLPLGQPPTTGSRSRAVTPPPIEVWSTFSTLSSCWVGEAWGAQGVVTDSGKVMNSPCWILCRRRTQEEKWHAGSPGEAWKKGTWQLPQPGSSGDCTGGAQRWGIPKEQAALSPKRDLWGAQYSGQPPPSAPGLGHSLSVTSILWSEMLFLPPSFPSK